MKLLPAATALLAIFAAFASPAFAKEDCDAGFKTHMGKMSIYIEKLSGNELADVVRKSLELTFLQGRRRFLAAWRLG